MGTRRRIIIFFFIATLSEMSLGQSEKLACALSYIPDSVFVDNQGIIKYFQRSTTGEIHTELGVRADSVRLYQNIFFDSSKIEIFFLDDGRTIKSFEFFDNNREEWWLCKFNVTKDKIFYLKEEFYFLDGVLTVTKNDEGDNVVSEISNLARWIGDYKRPDTLQSFQIKEYSLEKKCIYHLDLDRSGNGFEFEFNEIGEVVSIVQFRLFSRQDQSYNRVNGALIRRR